uniref:Uncharacterized protein n=1 Tax=Strigamia maritima TaxID=126957 RepID=T1JIZ0_STRMM
MCYVAKAILRLISSFLFSNVKKTSAKILISHFNWCIKKRKKIKNKSTTPGLIILNRFCLDIASN